MNENENLVTEQVTENTEQTAEQTPKTYTQEEVNEIVGKRIARKEAKIRKEYDRKYGDLENVLKAGTGKESVEEMTDTFRTFYEGKGKQIPQRPSFSDRDIEFLASKDAEEIISYGYEEVVEEVDRLAQKGANMTPREAALFRTLANYRLEAERGNELSQIGVTEDVYNSKEFKDFAAKFNPNTPISEVYDFYKKTTQPKKEIGTAGSLKQNNSQNTGVKDFYSPEDIERLSEKDLANPEIWAAVRRSMTGR